MPYGGVSYWRGPSFHLSHAIWGARLVYIRFHLQSRVGEPNLSEECAVELILDCSKAIIDDSFVKYRCQEEAQFSVCILTHRLSYDGVGVESVPQVTFC